MPHYKKLENLRYVCGITEYTGSSAKCFSRTTIKVISTVTVIGFSVSCWMGICILCLFYEFASPFEHPVSEGYAVRARFGVCLGLGINNTSRARLGARTFLPNSDQLLPLPSILSIRLSKDDFLGPNPVRLLISFRRPVHIRTWYFTRTSVQYAASYCI